MPLDQAVRDALTAQNRRLPPSPARERNLERLAGGARAVVTGQQVGLFLGPLFTLYKAATAVRLARAEDAVPVFWLQTEDHDLPEISTVHIAPGAPPLSLPASPGERIAIAHRVLPDEITPCLSGLASLLAGHVHAEAHLARIARHYKAGASWSGAFAGLLADLFAAEGLVFLDPRDRKLAALAAPIHERALREAGPIAEALGQGPVHVRVGAPLSFFHPDGPTGPRYRLEPEGELLAEVGGKRKHRREDLLAALAADPLHFSTSALLRPILQDTLLPTSAYIGGPAEVAYFKQLPPLYAHYGLPAPRVLERTHLRIVDDKTSRLLEKLGLACDDAARGEEELLARCRPPSPRADDLERRVLEGYDRACDGLAKEHDDEVGRARRGIEKSLAKLGRSLRHAELHRDAELVAAVRRLKTFLVPGGIPQERFYGLPWFAARFGDRSLLDSVIGAAEPFDGRLKDLRP